MLAHVGTGAVQSQLVVFELNGTLGADGLSGLSLQQACFLPSSAHPIHHVCLELHSVHECAQRFNAS